MKKHIPFVFRIMTALILFQTLRFKFTAHPESIYIFTKVGLEPYGRIGVGILELMAGILLLIPKTVWFGALLTIIIIGGAIVMHLTKLGIEVNNDNGLLFITAVVTFVLASVLMYLYRKQSPCVNF